MMDQCCKMIPEALHGQILPIKQSCLGGRIAGLIRTVFEVRIGMHYGYSYHQPCVEAA